MPCQGPTKEEILLQELYKEKLKDPIFLQEEAEKIAKAKYEWENFGRKKFEDKIKLEKELEIKKHSDFIENQTEKGDLENIAFNSFMTVFLCKAMTLIETNNLMQHTYNEMEWWWNEHKYRDKNNDKSSLTKQELTEKLLEIINKYKVETYL